MLTALSAWLGRDEKGQGLAEYALILTLIAIVAIVSLIFLGGQITQPEHGRRFHLTDSHTRTGDQHPWRSRTVHPARPPKGIPSRCHLNRTVDAGRGGIRTVGDHLRHS